MANYERLVKSLQEAVEFKEGKRHDVKVIERCIPDVDVKLLRQELKLTQEDFAVQYGIPTSTVRNWEQGVRKPEGTARILLNLIRSMPNDIAREVRKLKSA